MINRPNQHEIRHYNASQWEYVQYLQTAVTNSQNVFYSFFLFLVSQSKKTKSNEIRKKRFSFLLVFILSMHVTYNRLVHNSKIKQKKY